MEREVLIMNYELGIMNAMQVAGIGVLQLSKTIDQDVTISKPAS
jgi:hypothetical protein